MKPNIKQYKIANNQNSIKFVTQSEINKTLDCTHNLLRNREPILIHDSFDNIPQRYINCLNPKSYVQPHMHNLHDQWELMSWLSGEIIALFFDNNGTVTDKFLMNDSTVKIIEIQPFQYHSFVAITDGAYLARLKLKGGFYLRVTEILFKSFECHPQFMFNGKKLFQYFEHSSHLHKRKHNLLSILFLDLHHMLFVQLMLRYL